MSWESDYERMLEVKTGQREEFDRDFEYYKNAYAEETPVKKTYFVEADTVNGCVLLDAPGHSDDRVDAEDFMPSLRFLQEGDSMWAELSHEQTCKVAAEYGIEGFNLTEDGQFWPAGSHLVFKSIAEAMADYHCREVEYHNNPYLNHANETYYVQIIDSDKGRFYRISSRSDDGSSTDWEGIAEVDDWWDEDWTDTKSIVYATDDGLFYTV